MFLTKFLGKLRLLILCTWGLSRRADICSSFRHELTVAAIVIVPIIVITPLITSPYDICIIVI